MFNAIQYVTSGLALTAFLGALAAMVLRARTKSTERVVSRASPEDLPEIVRNILDRLQVPLLEIPEQRRAEIALEMLRLRYKRFSRLTVGAILITVIAAVTYLLSRPQPAQAGTLINQEEKTVLETKEQIVNVRGDFEALAKYPSQRSSVMKNALGLADIMLAVPDNRLSLGYQIVKHQYATFAIALAAATSSQDQVRRSVSQKAEREGQDAIDLYDSIRAKSLNGDQEATETYNWLISDEGVDRTRYLMAWAIAIDAKAGGQSKPSDAIHILGQIDCNYLERFPPSADMELGWVLEVSGASKPPCIG
jgi:hypothetical protein